MGQETTVSSIVLPQNSGTATSRRVIAGALYSAVYECLTVPSEAKASPPGTSCNLHRLPRFQSDLKW